MSARTTASAIASFRSRLTDAEESKTTKALSAASVAVTTWKSAIELYGAAKVHFGYTIAVTSDSELFWPLQRWVTNSIAPPRRRALLANLDYRQNAENLRLHYDGEREQFLRLNGHRISVAVRTAGATDTRTTWERYKPREPDRVVLTAFSVAGREAITKMISGLADELLDQQRSLPDLYVWTKTGWAHSGDLHPRPLDTVHLAPGQVERITSALDTFKGMEQRYLGLGLPWHLGFLFHGPPGTGKSSIARAIATHFHRNLYYLSLSSLESDEALFEAVATIRQNSAVLLEDVDTVRAMVDRRSADDGGISMSAVLNVLDGVMTPHGLVKILSTNDLAALDPAIYRPGRVDVVEKIDFASVEVANAIFARAFDGVGAGVTVIQPETKPAEVVGAIKPHLNDVVAARSALLALCAGEVRVETAQSYRPVARRSNEADGEAVPDTPRVAPALR